MQIEEIAEEYNFDQKPSFYHFFPELRRTYLNQTQNFIFLMNSFSQMIVIRF